VPLSSDLAKRAVQVSNLRRDAAVKHGARSEAAIREGRERFLAELQETFPHAAEQLLAIQAQRLSQLEQLTNFLDQKGPILHWRYGRVREAAQLHERIATSAEKTHLLLEAQARENGGQRGVPAGELAELQASAQAWAAHEATAAGETPA
jgi:hypothetical protein